MWKQLFEINSTVNSDKIITSTTIMDNFEVNENNSTSIEGSQIISEANSNIGDKKL